MTYLKNNEQSNYDKYPMTVINGLEDQVFGNVESINKELQSKMKAEKNIIVVDCTVGVNEQQLIDDLKHLGFELVINSIDIFCDSLKMDEMLEKYVTDDRVFGKAYYGKWMDFVDADKLQKIREMVDVVRGDVLIIGVAASYVNKGDIHIFADMTIWEIQMRYRKGLSNYNCDNGNYEQSKKFKRGYFVDWRLSNRHKKDIFEKFDYYLDTVDENKPVMITRTSFDDGLKQMLTQPFRTIPFFDEGLWGGQWMKEVIDIEDKTRINYAWSYNCLFPENEVNLSFNGVRVNIPGYTVSLKYPKELIGEKGFARFGAEYPIRFDFLDTMEGGNLSLQVHPDTQYFQDNFAMPFTQDESYYFLDCAENNTFMYLGLKDTTTKQEMKEALLKADNGEGSFDTEKYINKIPVKKHEHYHIPAGIVHCSGSNTMVLEISSAPCIFTFKLWDWDRIGMDGKPRPINIERGAEVIQWDKHEKWMKETCAFKSEIVSKGEGYIEERTGMHEYQFIETRRYWQSVKTFHETGNETHVLNLIEGREALIESPVNQFEPYIMHFAESVVIPALIGEYTITPCGESAGKEIGLIKAYVRF